MKSRTNIKRFLVDWAAVLALMVCFVAFTAYKGNSFMSTSNMVNICLLYTSDAADEL